MPAWFSPMTVPNQRTNMKITSAAPGRKIHAPNQSFRYEIAPNISVNSATEPTIGHGLLCGM
jgi:hypothetical protein